MNEYDILKKYFGYSEFREGQHTLIESILNGQDVLGIMPTGAGKSICYQVPALLLPGITVVISPLISLMTDQVQALNQAGIHAAYINSSLTEGQITRALQLASQGRYKIIYVAPERLETYEFRRFAQSVELSMVTVDEAHCISQWGQDFRPSYLNIVKFIRELPRRPIVSAFTATATVAVKEDITAVLGLRDPMLLTTGFDRQNLYFAVERPKKKEPYLIGYVKEHEQESGIIYCATRKNVDMIYEKLKSQGIAVTRYHAGLNNEERRQNQEDFIYDRSPVVVATNAFGMGIDKSNVRYVLHYNMPQSLENYYQEAGRAGRDGENAECILLYSPQDVVINRLLMNSREPNPDLDEEENEEIRLRDERRLQLMINYCVTTECQRNYMLQYFGEEREEYCGNCSNCLREFVEKDCTREAKLVIACIRELHQRYGITMIAGTLAGANTAKIRESGANQYLSYGSLQEYTELEIKKLLNDLILEGILRQTTDRYAIVKLTERAGSIESGEDGYIRKTPAQELTETEERYAAAGRSAGSRPKRAKKTKIAESLGEQDQELFEILRGIRTEYAREKGVPPYLVFSDKTLVDMCSKKPLTREQMLEVSGVGENKYEKYGERFLQAVAEYQA